MMTVWQFEAVRSDPYTFAWAFLIYIMINVPSDLYLCNHLVDSAYKKGAAKAAKEATP